MGMNEEEKNPQEETNLHDPGNPETLETEAPETEACGEQEAEEEPSDAKSDAKSTEKESKFKDLKKKFTEKKPSLEDEVLTFQNKAVEMEDRWKRSLAEFDNYRKRTEKEKEQSFDRGVEEACEKILPALDNFERALAGTEDSEDPFVKGMRMVEEQLEGALKDLGVTEIEALGQPFDPNLHFAVAKVDSEDAEEGTVTAVFQKGYRHKDKVIRCSMVQVAN